MISACARAPVVQIAKRCYSTPAQSPTSTGTRVLQLLAVSGVAAAAYAWSSGAVPTDPKAIKDLETKAISALRAKGEEAATASAQQAGALDPKEFRNFKLAKILPYNHNTSRFIFDLPEGTSSGLSVAACLVTKAADSSVKDDKGKDVIRPYTPTTAPSEKGQLELLIKKYKGGKMTEHIHGLQVGDELAMKGPIPKLAYKANEFDHIGMVMGGSGITPGWQIIQAIDADDSDKTKVTLLYANVTADDILLREEFDRLQREKPQQFKIVYALDKPPKEWKGLSGYISADALGKYLPPAGLQDKVKILVCGPPGMYKVISGEKLSMKDQGPARGFLADLGYSDTQIFRF